MKKIQSILKQDWLDDLRYRQRQLAVLTAVFDRALAKHDINRGDCAIVRWDENELYINAETNAIAFRLTQILPYLQAILQKNGFNFRSIRLRCLKSDSQ